MVIADETERLVEIGPGTWLGKVYYELLTKKSWVLPGGDCPSVGIAGHSQGGGYGVISRKWGLVSDYVVRMDIVNAKGELLIANATSNQDLYWSLRGAGAGSYGVITKFYVKAVPMVPTMSLTVYDFAAGDAEKIVDMVVSKGGSWAENVTTVAYFDTTGAVRLSAFNYAPNASFPFAQIEADFPSTLSAPPNVTTKEGFYLDLLYPSLNGDFSVFLNRSWVDSSANSWSNNFYFDGRSLYLSEESFGFPANTSSTETSSGAKALLAGLYAAPQPFRGTTWFQLDAYGASISTCGKEGFAPFYNANWTACQSSSSFSHRNPNLVNIQYYTSWNDYDTSPAALSYMGNWSAQISPWSTKTAYQNYIDSSVPLEWYYGSEGLQKLISVKEQYDPTDAFRFAQSIPMKQY